ncbi:hypothetical protein QTP88_008537 [Uroleucon formosanum]
MKCNLNYKKYLKLNLLVSVPNILTPIIFSFHITDCYSIFITLYNFKWSNKIKNYLLKLLRINCFNLIWLLMNPTPKYKSVIQYVDYIVFHSTILTEVKLQVFKYDDIIRRVCVHIIFPSLIGRSSSHNFITGDSYISGKTTSLDGGKVAYKTFRENSSNNTGRAS